MRIVFMGTPEIAAVCLRRLLAAGLDVAAVYTQPDRPQGRHQVLTPSPVKRTALERGIPVYQPEKFRQAEVVEELRQLHPDVIAVVAYGCILPQSVLNIPPLGCINIHASLLPRYRGAAPYQWAVLKGERITGVTAMFMDKGMDTGDIIRTVETEIGENETAGELLERLAPLGAELLADTLAALPNGVERRPQDPDSATYAPMLDKTHAPLDWSRPAQQLHDQVRGLNPWPIATGEIGGTVFKIYETRAVSGDGPAGTVLSLDRQGLRVACGEGALEIRTLQAPGGKRMSAADYFRGHPLEAQ